MSASWSRGSCRRRQAYSWPRFHPTGRAGRLALGTLPADALVANLCAADAPAAGAPTHCCGGHAGAQALEETVSVQRVPTGPWPPPKGPVVGACRHSNPVATDGVAGTLGRPCFTQLRPELLLKIKIRNLVRALRARSQNHDGLTVAAARKRLNGADAMQASAS